MKSSKGVILRVLLISVVILIPVIIISGYHFRKKGPIRIKEFILPEQGGPPLVETEGWPVSFSAQMLIKEGGRILRGKIFYQNGKMRQEFQDKWGQTITIVRPDKKIIWVVLLKNKAYVELPLKESYPGHFIQMPPDALKKRLLGTETVGGYAADKYEVTVRRGKNGVEKQDLWMARQLGVPIKVVVKDRNFSIEYRNIKEDGEENWLFDPPPGFKKATQFIGFTKR